MSLTEPETQALGCIANGLAGADPRLASMLTIFTRHPRRGTARPQPRRRYPRLGWQPALLVLGAVIAAALLTAALALTASGPTTCARPMGTACPPPSLPQQAGAGRG
jgi:hypothetical protein